MPKLDNAEDCVMYRADEFEVNLTANRIWSVKNNGKKRPLHGIVLLQHETLGKSGKDHEG
jgi:hypothetical protein